MNQYDNYTPEIPYTVEQPAVRRETQQKKEADTDKTKRTRQKQAKQEKPRRQKQTPSGISLAENIKKFANLQNTKLVVGLLLGCVGVYLLISFFSYFINCIQDQSAINNSAVGTLPKVSNAGGEGGARISEFLINEGFGLGSGVIVFWLIAMSLKLLAGKPRFKSVDFTIKCFVALLTVSLIVGLLTLGLDTPVNWGGYHGRYVNQFIIGFVGWSGAGLLCLFMVAIFFLICLRDFVNWILRIKRAHDERRRIAAEEKAAIRAREEELARMQRQEEIDAAKAGEASVKEEETENEDSHVSFNPLYDHLPEDVDNETEPLYSIHNERQLTHEETHEDTEVSEYDEQVVGQEKAVNVQVERKAADAPAEVKDNDDIDPMTINVNQIGQSDKKHYTSKEAFENQPKYNFPPFDLLRQGVEKISVDVNEQIENKERIREALLDFGISIVSIEATVGPTVTLYEVVPDKGVKISKIRSLVDDIALRLSARGIRIIAPIPGKGTVGIEVANRDPQTVSMRSVIKSRKFMDSRYELPIALGSTISNEVYVADLTKMPHLLVAGATGQGKSVGLNAIISSLLYCKTPRELKFVMIDPKQVEFSLYSKLRNYYMAMLPEEDEPVITDVSKAEEVLVSLCQEMDDRYSLLKMSHTKKITEYNAKIAEGLLNPMEGHRFLPYIVVIVDEFSDLIMTAGKSVEQPIARLAQKARAIGIHVIIATQRPSTNVITGLIKANFPVRIAFKVSSGIESKIILDTTGAQQLIGRGDLLILNNSEMVRVQCAFIDTPEVEDICDYIERQPYPTGPYMLPEPKENSGTGGQGGADGLGSLDPKTEECAIAVVESGIASTSSLQRRFEIGYNRAGKIMDQMEALGIVGPSRNGKTRDILVDRMKLDEIFRSLT